MFKPDSKTVIPPAKELEPRSCFESDSTKTSTTDLIMDGKVSNRNTYYAAFAALLVGVVTGMLGSYSAPASVDMAKPGSRFRYTLTSDDVSWIASMPFFSGILGNGLAGYLTQKFGRHSLLILVSCIYVVFFLTVVLAGCGVGRWGGCDGSGDVVFAGVTTLAGKDANVRKELEELQEHLRNQDQPGLTWKEVIEPTFYKPLAMGLVLMIFFQFVGVYAILSYAVEIFQNSGSSVQPNLASAILSLVSLVGNAVGGSLLDRFGRRPMYLISSIGTTLSYAALGTYSYVIQAYDVDPHHYGWIPLASLATVIFAFNIGIGVIPYLMIPELVPQHSRSVVMSVTSLFGSLLAFVVIKMFDALRVAMGEAGLYWMYGGVAAVAGVFCWFFLPETKGLTLREIQEKFAVKKTSSS